MINEPLEFRARRIDIDRWVQGHYFVTPLSDENSGTSPDKGWFFLTGEKRHCIGKDGVAFVIDPNTLSQFTGMKDRNGKKIFGGDIVKRMCLDENCNIEHIGVVRYSPIWCMWQIDEHIALRGEYQPPLAYGNPSQGTVLEVVILGNITENPELINGK